uniref:Uncharacterized protein n=1 Tax=Anopheles coluzzii TaxID=1518534 RepID=A0A8W7PU43_ANOCL
MGSRSGPGSSGVLSSASVGGNGGGVVVMWIASSGKLFERGGTVDSVGSADNVLVAKATITSRVPDTGGIIVFWLAAIFIVEYCFYHHPGTGRFLFPPCPALPNSLGHKHKQWNEFRVADFRSDGAHSGGGVQPAKVCHKHVPIPAFTIATRIYPIDDRDLERKKEQTVDVIKTNNMLLSHTMATAHPKGHPLHRVTGVPVSRQLLSATKVYPPWSVLDHEFVGAPGRTVRALSKLTPPLSLANPY